MQRVPKTFGVQRSPDKHFRFGVLLRHPRHEAAACFAHEPVSHRPFSLPSTLRRYVDVCARLLAMAKTLTRVSPLRSDRETREEAVVRIPVLLPKDQRLKLKVFAASGGVTISEVVWDGIARFLGSKS